MISTTRILSWLLAVVLSLSMASVAMATAVSYPKVVSVAERSLSMVFGHPTTWMPKSSCNRLATPKVSSPPMATRASTPNSSSLFATFSASPSFLYGLVREEPRMVPPSWRM